MGICIFFFFVLHLVAHLSFHHEKAIKALSRTHIGVVGHLPTTLRWWNPAKMPFSMAQRINLPACSPHCPVIAERQSREAVKTNF